MEATYHKGSRVGTSSTQLNTKPINEQITKEESSEAVKKWSDHSINYDVQAHDRLVTPTADRTGGKRAMVRLLIH